MGNEDARCYDFNEEGKTDSEDRTSDDESFMEDKRNNWLSTRNKGIVSNATIRIGGSMYDPDDAAAGPSRACVIAPISDASASEEESDDSRSTMILSPHHAEVFEDEEASEEEEEEEFSEADSGK